MLAVKEGWIPRLLAVWLGSPTELSKVIVRSLVEEKVVRSCQGWFSGGVLTSTVRCQSDRQRFVLLHVFQIGEKRELVGCHLHSYGGKTRWVNDRAQRFGVQREYWRTEDRTLRNPSSEKSMNQIIAKLPSKWGHWGRMRAVITTKPQSTVSQFIRGICHEHKKSSP